jgi:hypothetical protein
VISVQQTDLNGNIVEQVSQGASAAGSPGKLAVMAATGSDVRLLLVILIMMQLPVSDLLSVAGC